MLAEVEKRKTTQYYVQCGCKQRIKEQANKICLSTCLCSAHESRIYLRIAISQKLTVMNSLLIKIYFTFFFVFIRQCNFARSYLLWNCIYRTMDFQRIIIFRWKIIVLMKTTWTFPFYFVNIYWIYSNDTRIDQPKINEKETKIIIILTVNHPNLFKIVYAQRWFYIIRFFVETISRYGIKCWFEDCVWIRNWTKKELLIEKHANRTQIKILGAICYRYCFHTLGRKLVISSWSSRYVYELNVEVQITKIRYQGLEMSSFLVFSTVIWFAYRLESSQNLTVCRTV